MANFYYDSNARTWREKCGCSGGDRTYTPLANTQPMIFAVQQNQNVVGSVTGKKYFVRPNMVALDIDTQDAQTFIDNTQAVLALPSMLAGKQGYRAILS